MRGRQRFVCVHCGLEVEGIAGWDGRVYPYDRAGYDGTPGQRAVCDSCAEERAKAERIRAAVEKAEGGQP